MITKKNYRKEICFYNLIKIIDVKILVKINFIYSSVKNKNIWI